jgi:hypothetical protein
MNTALKIFHAKALRRQVEGVVKSSPNSLIVLSSIYRDKTLICLAAWRDKVYSSKTIYEAMSTAVKK